MYARMKEDDAAVESSSWCREVRDRICWNVRCAGDAAGTRRRGGTTAVDTV